MAEQHIWMGNTSLLKLSHLTYRIGYALVALCVLGIARRAISALRKTTQVRSFHRPAPVLILGALYVSFVIGVFYHMLVNFLMIHVPGGTGGWYLYAAIVPEAILLVYGLQGITGRKWELAGVAMLLLYIAVVGMLSVFAKSIPSYAGFFIPNFHVQHLFQIYSPSTFKIVLQHLAANKPGFITPSLIGVVIAVYLFMVTHSLFHYAAMAESKRPAKPVYRQ